MNAILGFSQLIEINDEQNLTEEQQDFIQEIIVAGQHLLNLIDEVLDIARIESGKYQVEIQSVDIMQLIQGCIKMVRPLLKDKQISLTNKMNADSTCIVAADPKVLRQVLFNLLSNAIKYNQDHGEVIVSCQQQPNGRVHLGVRDTGPGIKPEDLGRVYEPFDRLDALGQEGTGIGLMVTRQLVELLGGTISIESEVGKGSLFCVDLAAA